MLEIITDENIMKSEEFLNDADCILADIKIEDTKFNRRTINEQIQNIAQKKDTLCRRMYN